MTTWFLLLDSTTPYFPSYSLVTQEEYPVCISRTQVGQSVQEDEQEQKQVQSLYLAGGGGGWGQQGEKQEQEQWCWRRQG